ncbi:hypothetical protein BC832DRAFT_343752 [Gaertneriomyces semiglobifer]|nr:hypothetical protein BC832DRAFT_343752 [Gaertneriomyces semiglobifer]
MPPWPQELAAALQHSLSNGSNSAAYVPSALGLGSVNQERSPACSVAPLASLAFTAPMDPMGSVMRSHALGAGVGGMASSAIASTVSMPLPPFTSSSDPFTSTQSLVSGTGTLAANLFRQLADSHITLASTTFPTNSSAGLVACPSTAATSTPSITVIPTTLVPISGTATASPIHTVAGTVLPQLTGMTSPTGMIAVPGLGVVPMSSIAHLFPAGYLQPMQTSSPPSRADDANLSNPMRPPQVKAQRKPKRRNDTVYDRLQKNLQRLGKGK